MAFPTTLPSYTITAGAETANGAGGGTGLSGLLNAFEVDITALGTKMGTGASTPSVGKVLRANGAGTSVWGAVDLTADVTGVLPVANGGTGQGSSTGSGAVVLATSPTLTTPILSNPTIRAWDGWEDANEAWTFLTSTTITVPTDATTKYDVGDYIKITQSATVKYFVILSLTATVLTVSGLAGATVANSAISANFYSKIRNPHGALGGAAPFQPYKFRVYRSAAQNTINGTTKILYDTKTYDTATNFDVATNNRFVAPIAGYYTFSATAQVVSTGNVQLSLYKNSSSVANGANIAGTGVNPGTTVNDTQLLAAGDFMEIFISAASAVALFVGSAGVYFTGKLESAI